MNLEEMVKYIMPKELGRKAEVYLGGKEDGLEKVSVYRQAHKELLLFDRQIKPEQIGICKMYMLWKLK